MSNTTTTPRTDAATTISGDVKSSFARDLERELAAERALADRLAESLDKTLQLVAESGDSPPYAEIDLDAWKEARRA